MIVPMKKVSLIVQSKDAASTVEKLGSLGVLHVEHQRLPACVDIGSLRENVFLAGRALDILSKPEFSGKSAQAAKEKIPDWKLTAGHIIELHKRMDQLAEYSRTIKNRISKWEAWGDFDPETIKAIEPRNIYIRLYQVPVKEVRKFPKAVIVKKLSTVRGVANCVIISRGKTQIPFKEINLPKTSLGKMRERLSENIKAIESIKAELLKLAGYVENFKNIKRAFEKVLEFKEALTGMGQAGDIMYLTGYIPHNELGHLRETAKNQRWGIAINDPAESDNVPTLIRNPRWVSLIAPVFKLIEVVPGYRELDISFWFLIFFSVFFGMLIGDAGYGLIFFMITLLAHKKFGGKVADKSPFVLFYLLSSCAIIWGVLSATFFGQEWLPESVIPLVPALRDARNVQIICFFLGALQLSVAHLWRSFIKLPSVKALSDIGWVLILWGGYFLARTLILGDELGSFVKWLFIAGSLLVILLTNPRKNVVKGIGSGLANLLMNIVNSFTDVVSYVRLFAVGLATVAIADAFNRMAMGIGFNSILTGVVTALILLLGHTLNVVLGPLAILVHGVRLNVLEFCSHLNITWSGISYKPLRKNNKS